MSHIGISTCKSIINNQKIFTKNHIKLYSNIYNIILTINDLPTFDNCTVYLHTKTFTIWCD